MVKVEELTSEEIEFQENRSKLLQITRSIIPTQRVIDDENAIAVASHSDPSSIGIYITPDKRHLSVKGEAYFEEAMKLARAYEATLGGEEFTIKKKYKD